MNIGQSIDTNNKNLCVFHPYIHPDNLKKIVLKSGETTKKVGAVIETNKFHYCPKCFKVQKEVTTNEKNQQESRKG